MITTTTTRVNYRYLDTRLVLTLLLFLFFHSGLELNLRAQSPVLILGINHDYPPYEFVDDSGKPAGLNVDLINALSEVCNLGIQIYPGDFNSLLELVKQNKIDGLVSHRRSLENDKIFVFSNHISLSRMASVTLVNRPVKSFNDALKLRIGVQKSDQLDTFLLRKGYTGVISSYNSMIIGLNALLANECDVFVGMEKQLEYIVNHYMLSSLKVTSIQSPPVEYSIVLNKKSAKFIEQLNYGLSEVNKSGLYDLLSKKWFPSKLKEPAFRTSDSKSLFWTWYLIIPVLLISLASIGYLLIRRRRVHNTLQEYNQVLENKGILLTGYMDAVAENFAIVDHLFIPIYLNNSMRRFQQHFLNLDTNTHGAFFDTPELTFIKNILPELTVGKVWQTDLNLKDEKQNDHYFELTLVRLKEAYGLCIKDITKQRKNDKLNHILLNIANAAISSSSLLNLYKVIHQEIATLFEASNFTVELYDAQTQTISVSYSVDSASNDNHFSAKGTLSGYTINKNLPRLFTLTEIEEMVKMGEINEKETIYFNWLGVPLIVRGACFGIISVRSYNDSICFSEDELRVMEFVSSQVASAIHRKLSDNEIIKALELAQEANHLKASFISKLSHEFRTPMTSILGFCSLLGERSLTESQYHSYLDSMKEGTDNLLKIIDQILDIAQIESGKLKIDADWVDIGSLIKELYLMFQMNPYFQKNKIAFSFSIENEPLLAQTDRRRLRDALGHLIDNAFKFTKSGSLEIGASHDVNNARVIIWIKDSGIGISDKLAETIFDSFRQGDEKISRSFEGMGLGLNLAKGFIDYMHGELWFEHNERGGTTFYIALPDHEETLTEGQTENLTSIESELIADYIWPGRTIVIAEDNLSNSRFLEAALTGRGLRLLFTNNGVDTINLVERDPTIDLILMDIQMPKVNGIEATKRIRDIRNDLPVIAVTAYAYNIFSEELLNSIFDAWLTKPVRTREILKILSRFLG